MIFIYSVIKDLLFVFQYKRYFLFTKELTFVLWNNILELSSVIMWIISSVIMWISIMLSRISHLNDIKFEILFLISNDAGS